MRRDASKEVTVLREGASRLSEQMEKLRLESERAGSAAQQEIHRLRCVVGRHPTQDHSREHVISFHYRGGSHARLFLPRNCPISGMSMLSPVPRGHWRERHNGRPQHRTDLKVHDQIICVVSTALDNLRSRAEISLLDYLVIAA